MISKSLQSSQISYSTQKQFLYNECKILKRYKPPVSGGFYLLAGPTGFEPAISSVTGRRDNPFTTGAGYRKTPSSLANFHPWRKAAIGHI